MPWEDFQIVGFVPDLPSNISGSIFCSVLGQFSYGMYPTAKGFRCGPTPETLSSVGGTSGALDTVSLGSAIVYQTDGTARVFIGTAAKLWEWNGSSTITDRSGTAYSATATNTWSFTQFGDITLAVNRGNFLQQINAGSAFAAVGAAPVPKASIAVTCGPVSAPFVMVFDFDDGTHNYRDGWFNSAISNPYTSAAASWTTGTSQCAQGRLIDDLPGQILGAAPYRDQVIVWKRKGMYIGDYGTKIETGWSWERRSHDIGILGKNCVVSVEDMLYWADEDGLWLYDGSYPRRIPGHCQKWWSELVIRLGANTDAFRHLARVVWDSKRRNIWFMLADSNSQAQTSGLVYHVDSQLWFPVYTIHNTANTATVYEFIGPLQSKWGAFIGKDKKLGLINYEDFQTGGPSSALITFGVIGDNVNQYVMSGLRPLILRTGLGATTVSAANVASDEFWRDNMTSMANNQTFTANGAKLHLDGMAAGRFLQPAIQFTAGNDMEMSAKGGKINLKAAGTGGS